MSEATSVQLRRAREIAFGLAAAWLVLQNMILFALFTLMPLSDVGTVARVLVRVALRAATPVTFVPGGGILEVAGALLAAGTGVHHG